MFCFACAVKLRPAVIVTSVIRCVERNLSTGSLFSAGKHFRNLNTRDGSAATIQMQGIKKRIQRRKLISVDDAGQLPGVSTAIQNSHRSQCRVWSGVIIYLDWFKPFRTSIMVYLLVFFSLKPWFSTGV